MFVPRVLATLSIPRWSAREGASVSINRLPATAHSGPGPALGVKSAECTFSGPQETFAIVCSKLPDHLLWGVT